MTDLSPLDILGKTFKKRLNGYDPQQVHEFLSEVGGVFEQLVRERGELRQQVAKMESDLAEFRRREGALQDALVAAQRSAEETVEGARRKAGEELEQARTEGQRTLEEAQVLAQRIMDETNERIRTLEGIITGLRGKRREARAEVLRLVEILEGVARDDQRLEHEEDVTPRVSLLDRRRPASGEGNR